MPAFDFVGSTLLGASNSASDGTGDSEDSEDRSDESSSADMLAGNVRGEMSRCVEKRGRQIVDVARGDVH